MAQLMKDQAISMTSSTPLFIRETNDDRTPRKNLESVRPANIGIDLGKHTFIY